MKDDKYVTCQMVQPFHFNEVIAVGICNVILDYLIDQIPKSGQNEFERKIYDLFNKSFDNRFKYVDNL